MQYPGVYAARVISNNDPMKKNRLTLQVPEVLGLSTTGWAESLFQGVNPPVSGSKIWVMFASGDPRKPLWLGGDVSGSNIVSHGAVALSQGSTVTSTAS